MGVEHNIKTGTPIREVMEHVTPGMRVGVEMTPTTLRLTRELIESGKKITEAETAGLPKAEVEAVKFFKELIQEIVSKGAEPVPLHREKLWKKGDDYYEKYKKETNKMRELYDQEKYGKAGQKHEKTLKPLERKMERIQFIESMLMLKNAVKKRVHVAVMGAVHAEHLQQATKPGALQIKLLSKTSH